MKALRGIGGRFFIFFSCFFVRACGGGGSGGGGGGTFSTSSENGDALPVGFSGSLLSTSATLVGVVVSSAGGAEALGAEALAVVSSPETFLGLGIPVCLGTLGAL
eukprot:CAMPEP_0171752146 /NCGR_PEP_ID=MMETSP0991-20121206/42436_1 /TAXON_ID=483369 /ORGANISM="non described non described, Strain CCMP2098" /LENGTH=104 /DNA_ID=CAMNT_0012353461 /DNA_START=649 /DNA_END=963 /DNA_ORIENTATION=+